MNLFNWLFDWSFLYPFLIKAVAAIVLIGIIGQLIAKYVCYTEPEDYV